jgi:hypothetical protein
MAVEQTDKEAEVVALSLRAKVDALEVIDQASYDFANALNKQAYEGKKAFHAWFDPIDEASKKQRQATIAQGKKIDDPFDYVIKVTGSKAAGWMRAEKVKAEEERRKAEEAARREAEEAQLRAAEALQKEGLTAAADAVLDAPVVVPKVEVAAPEKAEGVSYRDVWGAEVTCLSELVKAVAEGKAPFGALQANDTFLGQWARLTKGTESLPGVKVTNTPIQVRRM